MSRVCALLLLAAAGLSGVAQASEPTRLRVTHYYATGQVMADGQWPYYGAAACARRFPRGTRLAFPDGWTAECRDTGRLDEHGVDVDLFAPTPAIAREFVQRYGDWPVVEVVP